MGPKATSEIEILIRHYNLLNGHKSQYREAAEMLPFLGVNDWDVNDAPLVIVDFKHILSLALVKADEDPLDHRHFFWALAEESDEMYEYLQAIHISW